MALTDSNELKKILDTHLDAPIRAWMEEKLDTIIATKSAKDLYLAYSLTANKIEEDKPLEYKEVSNLELRDYLKVQNASFLQVARIYLLSAALEGNRDYFRPKVANLIKLADTGELETFLKFLILLPDCKDYKSAAVEALRTNIATVFDAISADNPYPSRYFNDQQWNQMYLKAAFMQQDLSRILEVDERANADLARIISDYAHERWAASREVDPLFWRPVGSFLEDTLLKDMGRLLQSDNPLENQAGALCCFRSDRPKATALLDGHPDLRQKVAEKEITWENIMN